MNYYDRIQIALDYIEDNLKNEIEIKQISKQACFSVSQFYIIFQAIVGETVKEYMRKRRLCKAAFDLRTTNKKIIDIAYDSLFESQEAFTRAFVRVFGITPGKYRRGGDNIMSLEYKLDLSKRSDNVTNTKFTTSIKLMEELNLIGMELITTEQEAIENQTMVKFESEVYGPRDHEIKNVEDDATYVYITKCPAEDQINFICGRQVSHISEVPEGMISKVFPPSKYGLIKYTGEMSINIDIEMKQYAFGVWLPNSGYEWAADYMISMVHFNADCQVNEVDIFIPLK